MFDAKPYALIADAIALLLKPNAEVVLHDVRQDRILYIAGAFSRRRAGDPSQTELADLAPFTSAIIGPYAKANVDGRALKSISIVLKEGDEVAALLCINVDISVMSAAQRLLQELTLIPEAALPVQAIFPSDWRERINAEVADFLQRHNTSLRGLARAEVLDLLRSLDAQGFFAIRRAAEHISATLGFSRATLYKRLASARQPREEIWPLFPNSAWKPI